MPVAFIIAHTLILDKQDSVCLAIDVAKRHYKATINDIKINGTAEKNKQHKNKASVIFGNGTLYFGQEQDFQHGGFQLTQCISEYLSDFVLYNRLLTDEEMFGYTSCFTNDTILQNNLLVDFRKKMNLRLEMLFLVMMILGSFNALMNNPFMCYFLV